MQELHLVFQPLLPQRLELLQIDQEAIMAPALQILGLRVAVVVTVL
jgi:hypothetical protein